MVLFVVLGLMTVAALALLMPPLLRRHEAAPPRSAYDLQVYRDQLRELDRDLERGLVGAEQHATARREVERRMLKAAPPEGDAAPGPKTPDRGLFVAFAVAAAVPLAAGSLYLGLGSPGLDGRPFAARERTAQPGLSEPTEGGEIAAMVERLAERLETQPNDIEGWLMLGRSYGVLERYDEALVALEHAERLSGGNPDVTAMLAEHRVFAAGGIVTPEAEKTFAAALARDPKQPGARFYLALGHAQAGDYRAALDGWTALARDTPPDAPWLPALRAHALDAAEILGVEPPGEIAVAAASAPEPAPGPTREEVEAAAAMPAGDRTQIIRGMVTRLAERLKESPDDLEGWRQVGRSYGVLGQPHKARDAYARAAGLAPGDPAVLAEYAESIARAAPEGAPVPEEAVTVFRRLAGIDPANPVALWHLGLAEAQRGDPAEASAYWNRLLAVLPAGSSDRAAVKGAIERLGEAPPGG